RGDVAIPLGIRRLPRPMPYVLLRYAVEGIASSLRGLAPRNDNQAYKPSLRPRCSAKGLGTYAESRSEKQDDVPC
ncbi:MAG TPA: hypothetical protein PKY35_10500, partial [Candidatus Hydrogenedentes bacterium]|nr:hypothetical protein [Candidatus Hydrogenedentota bacterium]